ncbi:MAG TPA: BadF/BadG/BcrA/BcrD ATPase family protein [Streptosporangiaceae bacterium]|nr:BadF/BadG/BcrA/BcrD ATPase family protein [Streptosporangiaceae bacterium]
MSEELPAVLAVDGGNSKTDVALVADDGTLLALARGPGMPTRLGDQTVGVIGELIGSAAGLAGRTASAGGAVARHLVACVANVDLPAEEQQLEQMLSVRAWTRSTLVANDTYAVLRAGLDDVPAAGARRHWGVGVTCGAGINCVGLAPDGRTARFLALGKITGDWGGGHGIGLEAQWAAARAADGRGPQTILRQAVPAYFGLKEPDDVAVAIHLGKISSDELAGLPPVVFAAADAGDEVAGKLVLRLAEEIFLLVRSAVRRLDLAGTAVPVILGGGVIAAGNTALTERITGLIRAEVPDAVVRVVREAPVAGAALLGLDLAGAGVSAKQRLRDAFAAQLTAET